MICSKANYFQITYVHNVAVCFLCSCQVVSVALRIQMCVIYQNLFWNVFWDWPVLHYLHTAKFLCSFVFKYTTFSNISECWLLLLNNKNYRNNQNQVPKAKDSSGLYYQYCRKMLRKTWGLFLSPKLNSQHYQTCLDVLCLSSLSL